MAWETWKTQLRKGLLDLCVLNCLKRREYYGYDLVQEMKRIEGLAMREGTVYPILARLEEDGLVRSEARPSDQGPPRKYFQITPQGLSAVEEMNLHWTQIEAAVRMARDGEKGERQ